ncbi:hypothetical protein Flexsi_0366 [Flexistipes sinusarabici DSM 4947]|uniref:Uncharacterized protein n=1 Tax=Flexistipes sinusarabici (strain ATCC 49648 / DSM 4947 / MAS 10) TaxID=717231 RepID=F8E8K5_FLESM|nr:sulfotransferase [Flexistipes sinusarabici]AEI14054.1 hypothetical protein Flexsi_0366 [Flexistipes sinusarabici DSM 4947]
MKKNSYEPIIIIGAPRSGTNMLRDVLTKLNHVSTWPCDEINYIWRHGNVFYPSDELPAEAAHSNIKRYIRSKFDWVDRKYDCDYVVEKTCANSLRVDFVDKIIPEAKYVFIKRDLYDAVASAMKRWTAELDIKYILEKARFVPLTDLPYYASKYIWNRFYRFFSSEKRLAFWGPKLDNMDDLLGKYSLEEICAIQWKRCVEKSEESFRKIGNSKFIEIQYEDFVKAPKQNLQKICSFIGITPSTDEIRAAVSNVELRSVGKGIKSLNEEQVEKISAIVSE